MRLRTITGEPANPYQGGVIASTVKAVALCGGALVIVQAASAGGHHEGVAAPVVPVGRVLLVSFVITGGVQHFIYAPFVATLVDVTGLVIYFSTALIFLRGTVL